MDGRSTTLHVGLDVGKQSDPSAVVVVELARRATGRTLPPNGLVPQVTAVMETTYTVRHMERLPLGMSYPEQADYLLRLLAYLHDRAAKAYAEAHPQAVLYGQRITLPERRVYADQTGVGMAVVDILRQAIRTDRRTADVDLRPITFTGTDRYDRSTGRMGKPYLVSRLQSLFQRDCIALSIEHPEADAMRREIDNYEVRLRPDDGAFSAGAFRTGTHDDLVTALGLACLEDPEEDYGVWHAHFPW